MLYKKAITCAQAFAIFYVCEVSATAASDGVLSIYFPTNLALGMAKSEVAAKRPAAVDIFLSLSGTNAALTS